MAMGEVMANDGFGASGKHGWTDPCMAERGVSFSLSRNILRDRGRSGGLIDRVNDALGRSKIGLTSDIIGDLSAQTGWPT